SLIPYKRHEPEGIEFDSFEVVFTYSKDGDHFLEFLITYRDNQKTSQTKLFQHFFRYKGSPGSYDDFVIGCFFGDTFGTIAQEKVWLIAHIGQYLNGSM